MKLLVYVLFISIFTLDFMADDLGLIGRKVTLLQEFFSLVALALVLMRATLDRRIDIHPKYIILFLVLVSLISISAMINNVAPGTLIAGVRLYFKYLPFFLVPAVFRFSDAEMQSQLKFLLALAIIQLPIAIFQRLLQFKRGILSGDEISGTLTISSVLSIYLISSIAVIMAFYLNKKISRSMFIILLFLLFIPTTINETKGTLILLPIAIAVPVLLVPSAKSMFVRLWPIVLAGILIAGVFVPIYDNYLIDDEHGTKLSEFVTDSGKIEHYLYGGAAGADDVTTFDNSSRSLGLPFEGTEERVSRIDSMLLPLRLLSPDPIKLLLGLGIGNVSLSFADELSGRYVVYFKYYGANNTVISLLLWETGILGLLLSLGMLLTLFSDAKAVSKMQNFSGIFALGWAAVILIMIVSMPYKNVIHFNVLGYLFWYFSGYVAATRVRRNKIVYSDPVSGDEKK